ncbi:uncharacterized protein PV09_06439 [Verruconis gallopava]|uniref:Uncharacterized protein n=1 Tax=Verruconis gallopava TaxID=253628 RepID=A0A0D1XJ05_9PEZI|nr:uncharacterized protein PV09_06439 [Verruconis gallopava]KIW02291.1 hypothetical protein PV09_06439 [Verruconis gallopava]
MSPIANIPSPKLPVLTFWYEFYYDVIKRGKYTYKIAELHDGNEGPIVRISPYDVHVNELEFHDKLYVDSARRRDRWSRAAKAFGHLGSTFATTSEDQHWTRCKPINKVFLAAGGRPAGVAPSVLPRRFLRAPWSVFEGPDRAPNSNPRFYRYMIDVVSTFAFGKAFGSTKSHNFGLEWQRLFMSWSEMAYLSKQFGSLGAVIESLPDGLLQKISSAMSLVIR